MSIVADKTREGILQAKRKKKEREREDKVKDDFILIMSNFIDDNS